MGRGGMVKRIKTFGPLSMNRKQQHEQQKYYGVYMLLLRWIKWNEKDPHIAKKHTHLYMILLCEYTLRHAHELAKLFFVPRFPLCRCPVLFTLIHTHTHIHISISLFTISLAPHTVSIFRWALYIYCVRFICIDALYICVHVCLHAMTEANVGKR